MEYICPLCNGINDKSEYCPQCGHQLEDDGKIEDYRGPYSPYQEEYLYMWEQEILEPQLGHDFCIHLFYCPNCSFDNKLPIHLITI